MTLRTVVMLGLLLGALCGGGAGAQGPYAPNASPAARAALDRCLEVEQVPAGARMAELDRLVARAEEVLAGDEEDATAHFAVFCALGKRLQITGVSFRALSVLRRLRREIDRTLTLAPDFVGALIGKAAMLLEAPRVVGGDPAESVRLLRRAVALAPDNRDAHVLLGRALTAVGGSDAAHRLLARTDG